MGMDPVKAGAFRDYLRVLRGLLHGEEVDYELPWIQGGERSDIRFLHPERGFIDVARPVPIYVAADGPLALTSAGVGVRFFLPEDLQADFGVAVPLSYRTPDNERRSPRFLFKLSSAFRLCPQRGEASCL